ncbi:hypothetical protein MKZ38_001907 [Zalerion maritima]|uniref:Uncharacterized protein n=1 Tax=Zalerion maritima TaxID=339359 RepID=A0AAD5RRC1_9PEZI|nr:hypothetical protein MKZ38_001907 [Zalerion maritima]
MQSLKQFRPAIQSVATSRTAAVAVASHTIQRPYHRFSHLEFPYKDDQNREDLKPRSTDSTKSTSADDVAHTDVAFNPKLTKPETEKKEAGKEAEKVNPLEASPANKDISKPQGDHGKEG